MTSRERIQGLRNLRQGYGTVQAAVGFWKSLEGEDLIEVYADAVARLEAAEAALAQARAFAEMVLECDSYGCENGPDRCLHAAASRQLEVLAASQETGQP